MSVRYLAIAFVVALLAAVGWKYGGGLSRTDDSARKAKKPIEFDNGSIRDTTTIVTTPSKGQPAPVGVLRKCERNGEVTYTDTYCPKGSKEAKVSKGTVNVVAGSTKQATNQEGTVSKGPGEQDGASLRDKINERAVNPK